LIYPRRTHASLRSLSTESASPLAPRHSPLDPFPYPQS
jgi:hypothetical protein